MRTIRLVVAYDGTRYAGWQRQPHASSIQEELEKAVAQVTGEAVRVVGAGRTDAGVHALAQVAHFHTSSSLPADRFVGALNHFLPPDIAVRCAEEAPEGFHARRDARWRAYRYLIWNRPGRNPLLRNRALFWEGRLELAAMREAASYLVGRHDFAAFCATGSNPRTTLCTLYRLEVRQQGPLVVVDAVADRFLRHMVRMMVGTLLEVGSGKRSTESVQELLAARTNQLSGPVVEAGGLYLVRVGYTEFRPGP
ncbi:MAG: tRNA pseudouridine(38-40) synthase TruA [Armatimonadota bacterium]|nr:tRNA pseudouridine(38-40) synthase TruA [Armatimonadota bacterium]MDR7439534.1 tRNA pseudouridine(38-40) synthase TruA [Armatimonadota bacterium]MDR7443230.1 tRNA pseudouridine(38-40) synthase TruA [Armatimonadota bacterium]MDR7563452.1 tRNA pseudouridine(38-40) synthase TruA [Armatimonadota bacterium]MDR7567497.1 tRNA pseudouridine(38-40) synthase TruA [Armatimonadota bacterium]